MQSYSENQIRALHSEFRGHKKYAGKLAFFDRMFGIIPFSFPAFDSRLKFFFEKEKMENLHDLFKNERNNPRLTERKFSFSETFVFNIKPANSNSSAYNHYILSSFLSHAPSFENWIPQIISDDKPVEYFLDEANGILNNIEYCLQYDHDKSFKLQCLSIFYKGVSDGFGRHVRLSDKKRKFTELFLYAQGIIYSNYLDSLKTAFRHSRFPDEMQSSEALDLKRKLELMQEMGIMDFLQKKLNGSAILSKENKISEIICRITGESPQNQQWILHWMKEHRDYQEI